MTTTFQFYEGTKTESSAIAKITIRTKGQLVLTRAAVDMLGENVGHVQVGFDPETKAVGIRRVSEDTPGSYRLRTQKSSPSRLVDAKRVFALHDVKIDKPHSYDVLTFGDGVVGFHLNGDAPKVEAATESEPPQDEKPKRKAK